MGEFDCKGFAAHLMRTAAIGEVVTGHIVKKAAEVVQKDAQARIGSYQDGIGGFPAWANLAESTIQDRINKGFTPDDPLLRTGELRNSIEVQSEGHEAIVGTPDAVALYQECGTEKIPPRPFLGPAGYASRNDIGKIAAEIMIAWIGGTPWKRPPKLNR